MIRLTLTVLGGMPRQPESVELENGETWRLEGECNHCGECCKGPGVPFEEHGQCAKLSREVDELGAERHYCTIYWQRPWICALWPRDPHKCLPEKCSLRWVRTNG